MSKTKTKMELVPTEETTEFKKTRMKEIRAMVSNALKKNQRIDLMDFTGTDIPRVMVALQDEVMNSRERHQKATKRIADVKAEIAFIIPVIEGTMELQGTVIDNLRTQITCKDQVMNEMSQSIRELHEENITLRNTVDVLR